LPNGWEITHAGATKPSSVDINGNCSNNADNDCDGVPNVEDNMIDDADLSGQPGYGTPDWYKKT